MINIIILNNNNIGGFIIGGMRGHLNNPLFYNLLYYNYNKKRL